jgi:hypothetical protein
MDKIPTGAGCIISLGKNARDDITMKANTKINKIKNGAMFWRKNDMVLN